MFIYWHGDDTVYLLLYVDDIVLTTSTANLLQRTIVALQREFAIKDLGPLHHFLAITIELRPQGLFLLQRQYTINILERAGMSDCKPCFTPIDPQVKLSEVTDPGRRRDVLPEPLRRAPVPHLLQARHRLRRSACVPTYAHPAGAPPHRSQADPALPPRLPRLWTPTPTIPDVRARRLHRC
jgi:hypothetical protein